MNQGMLTLSGAPSTTSHFGYNTSFHLDYNILSNLHYLGSPLGFCTLIFDLMRNLYIYKACIYIYSITYFFMHVAVYNRFWQSTPGCETMINGYIWCHGFRTKPAYCTLKGLYYRSLFPRKCFEKRFAIKCYETVLNIP